MSRYHLVALLFTAITCTAQPPTHTISNIDSARFSVLSDTWLADGTYVACGQTSLATPNGNTTGGYFILLPGATNARIVPMIGQEIDRGSNAATWVASDGAIVSILRNRYRLSGPGWKTEFVVWRATPNLATVEKYAIPQQSCDLVDAALLTDDAICLLIDDYTSGQVLFRLDQNLTPRRTVLLDGLNYSAGASRKVSPLSGGAVLMANAIDSSVIVTRLDSNLNVEWSRRITDRIRRTLLPEDAHRVGVLEKKDGTIVLAVIRYNETWAFFHLNAGGDVLGSWMVRIPGTSGMMPQMVENDKSGIVFGTGALGIPLNSYLPFVGIINSDWTDVRLFDCTPYARPQRRFAWMDISAASRGRIHISGRVAPPKDSDGGIVEVASAEWDVDGETPCDIRRADADVIPHVSTSSVANVTSTDYVPRFVGARYKQYMGEPWSAAAATYPCTSINGTTRDTMVLSGSAYETRMGIEPDLIRTVSQAKAGIVSAAIVSNGGANGSKMYVLPSITSDTVPGFITDVPGTVIGAPKLAIDAEGFVALAMQNESLDSIIVMASQDPESNGSFKALTRVAIGVPERTKLLDVLRASHKECALLLGSQDTLFIMNYLPDRYGSVAVGRIALPFVADTAYWIDRSNIMTRHPDMIISSNSDVQTHAFWTRGGTKGNIERVFSQGGRHYSVFRLPDPDSSIAIAAYDCMVTLPSILVDSVTNIFPVAVVGTPEIWALGRVGDDACIFKINFFGTDDPYCMLRYWRISRERTKLIPYALDQRPNASPTLWCESVRGGERSFIGIPTNAIGQTACGEGWSSLRMKRAFPGDSLHGSKRFVVQGFSAPSMPHEVTQAAVPLMPIGPCGDLMTSVSESLASTVVKDEANPAVFDMIPSGLLPATMHSYTIRDVQGRAVRTVHDVVPGAISTHDLPPGVYLMIIERDAGKITTLPFMVMQR